MNRNLSDLYRPLQTHCNKEPCIDKIAWEMHDDPYYNQWLSLSPKLLQNSKIIPFGYTRNNDWNFSNNVMCKSLLLYQSIESGAILFVS